MSDVTITIVIKAASDVAEMSTTGPHFAAGPQPHITPASAGPDAVRRPTPKATKAAAQPVPTLSIGKTTAPSGLPTPRPLSAFEPVSAAPPETPPSPGELSGTDAEPPRRGRRRRT